jgi:hypothetical protein
MSTHARLPIDPDAEALISRFEGMAAYELRMLAEITDRLSGELHHGGVLLPALFLAAKGRFRDWPFYDLRLRKTREVTELTLRADATLEGAKRDQIAIDAQMGLVYAITAIAAKDEQPEVRELLAAPWAAFVAWPGQDGD